MKNALVYAMLLVFAILVAAQTDKPKSEPGLKETPKQEYIPIGSLHGKIEGPAKDGKIRVALTLLRKSITMSGNSQRKSAEISSSCANRHWHSPRIHQTGLKKHLNLRRAWPICRLFVKRWLPLTNPVILWNFPCSH